MTEYIAMLVLALSLTAQAQEGPHPKEKHEGRPHRPHLTDEQKKQRDALIVKYDINKDGKLDKEERAKVSEEDRKLLRSFGPPGGPRGPRPHDGRSPKGEKPEHNK